MVPLWSQNQGKGDEPRNRASREPGLFHPDYTVGFGIAPNLLTLPASDLQALAGLGKIRQCGFLDPYRRWGLAPRPEKFTVNIDGRPIMAGSSNHGNRPAVADLGKVLFAEATPNSARGRCPCRKRRVSRHAELAM